MAYRMKYGFVEIALKRVGPKEFDRQTGRTDQGPQNPAELAAEKQISREPGKQNFARNSLTAAQHLQQPEQTNVRGHAGKGDDDDLRELDKAVGRPGHLHLPGK